jgi:hypothetical protein
MQQEAKTRRLRRPTPSERELKELEQLLIQVRWYREAFELGQVRS